MLNKWILPPFKDGLLIVSFCFYTWPIKQYNVLCAYWRVQFCGDQIRSDQSLSHVRLFATPWIAARQASLSRTMQIKHSSWGWSICESQYHMGGFPGGSVVKNLPANAGDTGSVPGSGRSPGEGNSNPLQCSCLGNLMHKEPGGLPPMGSYRVGHALVTTQ